MASKKATKKYLYLTNSERYEVTGEDGKYFVCGKTAFRKSNPAIQRVEEEKAEQKRDEDKEEKVTEDAAERSVLPAETPDKEEE